MENCLSCVESDRRRTQRGQDAWRARRGGRESWSSLALWCLGRGVYAASTRPSLLAFLGRAKLPSPPLPLPVAGLWEVFLSAKAPPQVDGSN